jgi:glycosyltransferase involved in cell wall biosynthesis
MMADFLLLESCNFQDYPVGGQTTFAKNLMAVFGNRAALVGISTDDTPIGRWVQKEFDGVSHWYLSMGRMRRSARKPLIPGRLTNYLRTRRYRERILSLGVRRAFIQAPEALLAVVKWGWESLCYRFPGVGNPLHIARYAYGRLLAGRFDRKLFQALQRVDVILASADEQAIIGLVERSRGSLSRERILQFPTRVDTDLFRPVPIWQARAELGIQTPGPVLVSTGRINRFKGWELLLQSFALLLRSHANARMFFVGDGEDRTNLEDAAARLGLAGLVVVTGFLPALQVAAYINAADLFVVGSYREGWSLAMLEALACGKAIVSTRVSGTSEMISQGQNGIVVGQRDPEAMAAAMEKGLRMPEAVAVSLAIAQKYAITNLRRDLLAAWPAIQASTPQNAVEHIV